MSKTRNVALKLRATHALIAKLPPLRQAFWNGKLAAMRTSEAVGAPAEDVEWDLAAANWLDRVYTVVSDEARRVRKEGTAALSDTAGSLGWSLWPLAIAAVAIAWSIKRR